MYTWNEYFINYWYELCHFLKILKRNRGVGNLLANTAKHRAQLAPEALHEQEIAEKRERANTETP